MVAVSSDGGIEARCHNSHGCVHHAVSEHGDWFVYLYVAKFGTGHMLQGTDLKLSPMSTCSCVEIRTAGEDIEGQAIHQYF